MDTYKILDNQDLGALASPFRQQLLEELAGQPDSAANIARRHDMSRQRVGYHMRELVKAGYLEVVEERQQRGLKEQLYQVRSFAYVHTAPAMAASSLQDRYSWASLLNLLARGLWDMIRIRRLADSEKKRVATLSMESELFFSSPAERRAFTEELVASVDTLVEKYGKTEVAETDRGFRLLIGAYPSLKHGESERSESNEHTKH